MSQFDVNPVSVISSNNIYLLNNRNDYILKLKEIFLAAAGAINNTCVKIPQNVDKVQQSSTLRFRVK